MARTSIDHLAAAATPPRRPRPRAEDYALALWAVETAQRLAVLARAGALPARVAEYAGDVSGMLDEWAVSALPHRRRGVSA